MTGFYYLIVFLTINGQALDPLVESKMAFMTKDQCLEVASKVVIPLITETERKVKEKFGSGSFSATITCETR